MTFNGITYLAFVRACANFKCEVADVNIWIPIDLRAVKCVSEEYNQPYREQISWYIRSPSNLCNSYLTIGPPKKIYKNISIKCGFLVGRHPHTYWSSVVRHKQCRRKQCLWCFPLRAPRAHHIPNHRLLQLPLTWRKVFYLEWKHIELPDWKHFFCRIPLSWIFSTVSGCETTLPMHLNTSVITLAPVNL